MTTLSPLVLCVGSVTVDHIFEIDALPLGAIKVRSGQYAFSSGGMAANAAVAVARLDGRASFCGRVGDDVAGRDLVGEFKAHNVDTNAVIQRPGTRTSVSAVIVDARGERAITNYRGDFEDDMDDIDLAVVRKSLTQSSAVLADVRWVEGASRLLKEARHLDKPCVLDADIGAQEDLAKLVAIADHVIFSASGLQSFAPSLTPEDALDKALAAGGTMAAVTMGEDGVLWREAGSSRYRSLGAFRVMTLETLAAGDVFHGAYALAMAEGRQIEEALRFASAAAAVKCSRRGGRAGMPTRRDVEEMLQSATY